MECLRSFADANEGSTDVESLADALACIQLGNPVETYEAMNPALSFRENAI